jgi:hypothetical protein
MVKRMTEPHKRNRHPKYKIAYRVNNWREYEQSLRDHGDITLCISQEAIDAWTPPQSGKVAFLPSEIELQTTVYGTLICALRSAISKG